VFHQFQGVTASPPRCIKLKHGSQRYARKAMTILNTSIKSGRFLRSSNVQSPSCCSLSSCGRDRTHGNIRVKRWCTFLSYAHIA